MSGKSRKIDKDKLKLIHNRNRERGLIIKALKTMGPSTISEITKFTRLQTEKVLNHIVALSQFGRITVVGEKESEFIYDLSE
jgi:predicted transcriptional regulator